MLPTAALYGLGFAIGLSIGWAAFLIDFSFEEMSYGSEMMFCGSDGHTSSRCLESKTRRQSSAYAGVKQLDK